MKQNNVQIGDVLITVEPTESFKLPSAADCNSPCWWSADGLHILTSTGHPVHSSGPDLEHLARWGEIRYTAWRHGGRGIEAGHQEAEGPRLG